MVNDFDGLSINIVNYFLMQLRNIRDYESISGKSVLVRADFNVDIDETGKVRERFKLESAKETVDFLLEKGAKKVALLTHFGRPEGEYDERYSVALLKNDIEQALEREVVFVPECIGDTVANALASDALVLLLENVRFYVGEELNDDAFAKQLVESFDIVVNEAFSVCHRKHASIVGVTKHRESFAGLHLMKEIETLERVKVSPEHPAVAVIGGAKIETKLPLIRVFENQYDMVLVGGKIANEAIDQKIDFSEKVILPEDFDSQERFDIGEKTQERFVSVIQGAKTIVWNGPMGKFEDAEHEKGTRSILEAIIANQEAMTVAGGGESLVLLEAMHKFDAIDFVSTGGGAMLAFLGGEAMPGLDVLMA